MACSRCQEKKERDLHWFCNYCGDGCLCHKPRKPVGLTRIPNSSQWPEYLDEQAGYYRRRKLKQDLLGSAEEIRRLRAALKKVIKEADSCTALQLQKIAQKALGKEI